MLGAAQSAAFNFYYKLEQAQLYVRWLPQDVAHFERVLGGNMQMELYRVDGAATHPEFTLLETKVVQPLAYSAWRPDVLPNEWDSLAITSVYVDELDAAFLQNGFFSPEYEEEGDPLLLRKEINNYALGYSWPSIERSGMGFKRPLDKGASLYALRLFPTAAGDTLLLDINVAAWEAPAVPELEAKFKNKQVELKWRTLEFRNHFFGWHLDRSLDNGQSWEPVFGLPLINDNDTIAGVGDALKYAYKTDYLPSNDVEVLYRLQGADFMGGRSEKARIVRGKGGEDISQSPLITNTMQTDSNYAVIYWDYDPAWNDKLQEFRIVVTDTTGKAPEVALEGILPSQRQASVWMKYRSNFFRVQAVSRQGTILSSFESLVMMYDDEPPAVPKDFQGRVDSTGLVQLSWITSSEPDLAGYYLFKSYHAEGELAMITPQPLPGPTYTDTVNMEISNEWVYYQLRSVDTRGNSSAFTPVLALKKPDVHPPAAARIIKVDNSDNRITLEWTTSPSEDAKVYRLLRKTDEAGSQWMPLLEFDKEDFVSSWADTLVVLGTTYSYTTQVVDDDGLVSDYAQPVKVRLKDYGVNEPIREFSGIADSAARSIVLNWEYGASPREFYLYKAKGDAPPSLLKVLPGELRSFTDAALASGATYHYILKAYFKNGRVSPYTEMISITLE